MGEEFPHSDTQVIDASQPGDATLGVDVDDAMRETRRAVNWLGRRIGAGARDVYLAPGLGIIDATGAMFVTVNVALSPGTLLSIDGGQEGQIVYLAVKESTPPKRLVARHNDTLIRLRDGRDFTLAPGDVLCLRNHGGASAAGGWWEELFRQLDGCVLGLVAPDEARHRVTVTNAGALQVEAVE